MDNYTIVWEENNITYQISNIPYFCTNEQITFDSETLLIIELLKELMMNNKIKKEIDFKDAANVINFTDINTMQLK